MRRMLHMSLTDSEVAQDILNMIQELVQDMYVKSKDNMARITHTKSMSG